MIFDTHAHLDDRAFDPDREALLAQLPQNGISLVMNPGCSLASSQAAAALAKQYDYVFAAVGSHPDAANEVNEAVISQYRTLVQENPKVRAIGEIGLDYHYETPPRKTQIAAFEKQLDLAKELGLPVIIHEREAHGDAMDSLRSHPDVCGVFHCYSGSVDMARWLVDRGWYLGFTGVVTFKNARVPLEVAKNVPIDRLLLETDCPYMTPAPHRGERNDSSLIRLTAERIAEVRNMSADEVISASRENVRALFGV